MRARAASLVSLALLCSCSAFSWEHDADHLIESALNITRGHGADNNLRGGFSEAWSVLASLGATLARGKPTSAAPATSPGAVMLVTLLSLPIVGGSTRAADRLASRGFERASPAPFASGPRDLIVVCHRTPDKVAQGRFRLDNLPDGRVDLLARCASAAIFTSHGVRRETRLWLALQDQSVCLCLDGSTARGMHPDERTLAAAMKRTLAVEHGATSRADTANGWSYHAGGLEQRLRELRQQRPVSRGPRPILQLHEDGEATLQALLAAGGGGQPAASPGAVLVLGDQLGFTSGEEALLASAGARRATVSPRGLLTSHCIVLAHHALDEAEARVGLAASPVE